MQNTFSVSFTQPVTLEKAMVEKLILRIAEIDIALDTLYSMQNALEHYEQRDECEKNMEYLKGQQLGLDRALDTLNVSKYMDVGLAIEKAKLYLQTKAIKNTMFMGVLTNGN